MIRGTILATLLVLAVPAKACGVYDTATEQRWAKQQKQYLSYADKVVRGTWKESSRTDDGAVDGILIPAGGDEKSGIALSFTPEINCGFPAFPTNGDHGTFYLRAQDISPGDYQADSVSYGLLHYIPVRK